MPEPRRFVWMGASRAPGLAAKARDLAALRDSVVDASGVSGAIWFSYLTALFYLLVSAGAVTHRDLFLENPVKLPCRVRGQGLPGSGRGGGLMGIYSSASHVSLFEAKG